MSSSSVNSPRSAGRSVQDKQVYEKEIYAFVEKALTRQQVKGTMKMDEVLTLRGTTHIDPLAYIMFGTNKLVVDDRAAHGDGWLPIRFGRKGDYRTIDQVLKLKQTFDSCLLRVFEGFNASVAARQRERIKRFQAVPEEEFEDGMEDEEDVEALVLSKREIEDLNQLATGMAELLSRHSSDQTARMAAPRNLFSTSRTDGRQTPNWQGSASGGSQQQYGSQASNLGDKLDSDSFFKVRTKR
jgi:small subunit ribosomal protein S24e